MGHHSSSRPFRGAILTMWTSDYIPFRDFGAQCQESIRRHPLRIEITLNRKGANEYSKVSYPIRYGTYHEARTDDHVFQFNTQGEIKYIQGRGDDWPHAAEWLKRTSGNDWVYYSSGGYQGVFDRFGEYYVPCFSYRSNSVVDDDPFSWRGVQRALASLDNLLEQLRAPTSVPPEARAFVAMMTNFGSRELARKGRQLHTILGGQVTVLPPDTRHADYDVIPLVLADGCLYHCRFCAVKSVSGFALRTRANVLAQMAGLRKFYGTELANYNALFLGQHDALSAGRELIEFAAEEAYARFGFSRSYMKSPTLHLFGSVDSFLSSPEGLFEVLNGSPFHTYLNIGLESADSATLAILGKPVPGEKVEDAYARMLDINRTYDKIEVSANFVVSLGLPPTHFDRFCHLTGRNARSCGRGSIYVSPIITNAGPEGGEQRHLLAEFTRFKMGSSLPTYLYLIQRL